MNAIQIVATNHKRWRCRSQQSTPQG